MKLDFFCHNFLAICCENFGVGFYEIDQFKRYKYCGVLKYKLVFWLYEIDP